MPIHGGEVTTPRCADVQAEAQDLYGQRRASPERATPSLDYQCAGLRIENSHCS